MPTVGNRNFAYTKKGEQEAAAYAAETGQEVKNEYSFGYARGGEFGSPRPTGKLERLQSFIDEAYSEYDIKAARPQASLKDSKLYIEVGMPPEDEDEYIDWLTGVEQLNNMVWDDAGASLEAAGVSQNSGDIIYTVQGRPVKKQKGFLGTSFLDFDKHDFIGGLPRMDRSQGMQAGGMYPSEEDMALAHKASRGETGLRGRMTGAQEQKPDLQGYLNSDDHREWLNSPWDSENDIHMLKTIVGAMHMHGGYDEENTQKYLEDYTAMLKQVSNKKGSPPPEELHQTLREMQYGKPTEGMQAGGEVPEFTKESVRGILDAAKTILSENQELPRELREAILRIPRTGKELYGGFLSLDEDFAEEVDSFQALAAGRFERRKDGRWIFDNAVALKKGESPQAFVLKNYPLNTQRDSFGYGVTRG